MIALLALAIAWGEPAPGNVAGAVVRIQGTASPVHPRLDRLYRSLGVDGPTLRGVQATAGTGVRIAGTPWVVTAHHVVAGARTLTIDAPGHPAVVVDLADVRVPTDDDLALLPAPGWTTGLTAGLDPEPDAAITVAGFAHARDLDLRTGRAVARGPHAVLGRPARDFLEVDVTIDRGMSGGPAVDAVGRLVGIVAVGSTPTSVLGGHGLLVPIDAVQRAVHASPTTIAAAPPRFDADVVVDPGVAAALGLAAGDQVARFRDAPPTGTWGRGVAHLDDGVAVVLP